MYMLNFCNGQRVSWCAGSHFWNLILKICENRHLYSHLQMLSKDIIILEDYAFSTIEVIYFFV